MKIKSLEPTFNAAVADLASVVARRWLKLIVLLALVLMPASVALAQATIDIHDFSPQTAGAYPTTGLVQGSDGNFYGTSTSGGLGYGVIYRITPAGVVTTFHAFAYADGANPYAGLTLSSDGIFYGTTTSGGAHEEGTVFKITSTGDLTILHSFGGTDGTFASADLVQGTDGNFYGTTNEGGTFSDGTVFVITPGGVFTTLHSFGGSDGLYPSGSLVQGHDGNFYGTTSLGGTSGDGTVFTITPVAAGGVLTTLHSFTGPDGRAPIAGLALGSDGNFYGTTSGGVAGDYGTVFVIASVADGGILTTLHSFAYTDGDGPQGSLLLGGDGHFYGTTSGGGASGNGTIFTITPAGALTTLHSFTYTDGEDPVDALVEDHNGNFFGTTWQGGVYGVGTVFVLVTAHQTLTSIAVRPGSSVTLTAPHAVQFTATGLDQFGYPLATQPAFTWSLSGGSVGSLGATSGLYHSGQIAGAATVKAKSGVISSTATITVNPVPPVTEDATAYRSNPAHTAQATMPDFAAPIAQIWNTNFAGSPLYPIIAGGKVFVVTYAGSGNTSLYALSITDGTVLWGPISLPNPSAPTFDNGMLFLNDNADSTSGHETMIAIDASTGSLVWSTQLSGNFITSSLPTAFDGQVYTVGASNGSDGTLYAVRETDGSVVWTSGVVGSGQSPAAVTSNGVYLGFGCGQSYDFDPITGSQIWRLNPDCSGGLGVAPALYDGLLFTYDYYSSTSPNDIAAALNAETGSITATFANRGPDAFDKGDMFDSSSGTVTATRLSDWTNAWTVNNPSNRPMSPPTIVNGTVYALMTTGLLDGYDETNGSRTINLPLGETPVPNTLTDMEAGDGVIVVPLGSHLIAFGSSSVPPPTGLTATGGYAQATLAWTATGGSTSYNVYRGTSPSGEYGTSIATELDATGYTDTGLWNGTAYYYSVATVEAADTSALSNEASAIPASPVTVATPASASPNPVIGTAANLSVLGAYTGPGGESVLTYTWLSTCPSAVTYSDNGDNGAKNTMATFAHPGSYWFTVSISDGVHPPVTSSVNVTINQTLTSITVTPGPTLSLGPPLPQAQQFTATAFDQYGNPLSTQPTFSWSLESGWVGSISTSGLYHSGTVAGTATVKAKTGAVSGTCAVTVN